MLSELKNGIKVIGLKQSQRAVADGRAKKAFVAKDAEKRVTENFLKLCTEQGVEIELVETMRELGEACEIEVSAAVAVALTEQALTGERPIK